MTVLDLPRLLGAGAGGLQRDLAAADAVIRAPLALNQRIAVVQLRGGSGASATAAAVASLIARRRAGTVLAVDAAAGTRSMLWHAGIDARTEPTGALPPAAPRSAEEATAGLPRTGAGLVALDLRGPGHRAVQESAWAAAVAPMARFTEVVVTDWGVRVPEADLGLVAAGAQAVCLVCRADRGALEAALASAAAVTGMPHRPRLVVAAVDLGATAGHWPPALLAGVAAPVHRIPFDPVRAEDRPVPSRRTAATTRIAVARLAAALLDQGRAAP